MSLDGWPIWPHPSDFTPGFGWGIFLFLIGFMCCKFLGVGLDSGGFLGSWLCGGGFLGFFSEFLLDVDGVAGDVFAALAEEEPDENKD